MDQNEIYHPKNFKDTVSIKMKKMDFLNFINIVTSYQIPKKMMKIKKI